MLKQLIYASQPFGFDRAMLAGILLQARRNNPDKDITGALVCRADLYLQLIEGPVKNIDALFEEITADDRHTNVRIVFSGMVEDRLFPDWAMLDDQSPTLTWSGEDVAKGAVEAAKPAEARKIFEIIAAGAKGD
ncbi:BLUF domain-containing protein [Erythrobacter crassostreae]|uniref:BLUF domain-containing protein n=1 Tax=Erythrobacter crassostreae TaxID=2828328 RepID=A0A9X1JJQ4_9SPHN|nr:BLUF domain-containing protein [Erythrobacter crassostrea]MBV7258190.1 BLUF domain-containing protein [Erythrobacter crassostrea]